MNRRAFILGLAGLGGAAWAGGRWWPDDKWQNPCLSGLPETLANHPLIRAAWEDLNPEKVWDMHVHVAGTGDSGSGMAINPAMDSLSSPVLYVQKRVFMDAACVGERSKVDETYLARLLDLAGGFPPGVKLMLYAMEHFHAPGGKQDEFHTGVYVPNDYVRKLAQTWPQRFEWVASLHPYRDDAVQRLEQYVKEGAIAVKWLPSAMGIDPASPRCDAFYDALVRHDIPLIVHAGTELSVVGEGHEQDHNNPLRLRRTLENGVRVVAAHCASLGMDYDWDAGSKPDKLPSFELFARLMDEPHGANLYADLSAVPQLHRCHVFPALLENAGWHGRLLNGSDYPLPGIQPIYLLKELVRKDLLAAEHAEVLNELRAYNPLLFDFVLKRSIRWQGTGFPVGSFETRTFFQPATKAKSGGDKAGANKQKERAST